MKNLQLHYIGDRNMDLRESDFIKEPMPDEVQIKILYCGICGSDYSYTQSVKTHTKENSVILGHEMTGEVIKIGTDVKRLSVGDVVSVNPGINCGECEYCVTGRVNMCPNTKFSGYPPFDGFFQQYVNYPEKYSFKIPGSIDLLTSTLIEPLAVTLHSVNIAKLRFGMSVIIAGAGGIGSSLLVLLKKMGVKCIVIEPNEYRRELAKKLGADWVINPDDSQFDENLIEVIGNGVDRYFEASGTNQALTNSTKYTKIGGQIIVIGIPKNDKFEISHSEARKKALTIKMERTINHNIPDAINLLAKYNKEFKPIITREFSLKEAEKKFSEILDYKYDSARFAINCQKEEN